MGGLAVSTAAFRTIVVGLLAIVSASGHARPCADDSVRVERVLMLPVDFRVRHLAWSADGKLLALAGERVVVVDVESADVVRDFAGCHDPIAWSPDGRYLALFTAQPRRALRWDRTTSRVDVFRNEGAREPWSVGMPVWLSDDVLALSTGRDAWLTWGDARGLAERRGDHTFYYHAPCRGCPDRDVAVFEGRLEPDGTISVRALPAPAGYPARIVFLIDGRDPERLIVTPRGGGVVMMRRTGEVVASCDAPFDITVTGVTADGCYGVGVKMAGGEDGVPLTADLWVLDLARGVSYPLRATPGEEEIEPAITADGRMIASIEGASRETRVYIDRVVRLARGEGRR